MLIATNIDVSDDYDEKVFDGICKRGFIVSFGVMQ